MYEYLARKLPSSEIFLTQTNFFSTNNCDNNCYNDCYIEEEGFWLVLYYEKKAFDYHFTHAQLMGIGGNGADVTEHAVVGLEIVCVTPLPLPTMEVIVVVHIKRIATTKSV